MNPVLIRLIEEALEAGVPAIEVAESLATSDYQVSYIVGFCDAVSGYYEQQRPTLRLVQDGDTA
jgi:hypothetical protein